MSILRIRRRFALHLKIGLWVIIAVFVIAIPAVYFGLPGARVAGPASEASQASSDEAVAKVDGVELRSSTVEQLYRMVIAQSAGMFQLQQLGGVRLQSIGPLRSQALDQAVGFVLLAEAARKAGISVADSEVRARLEAEAKAEIEAVKGQAGKDRYLDVLAQVMARQGARPPRRMSEEAFLRWGLESTPPQRREFVRTQLAIEALHAKQDAEVKLTEQGLLEQYDQVRARHILVALKPPRGKPRTEAEAKGRAEKLLAKLKAGADFAALAKAESDDPGSAARGGMLDFFGHGQMVPAFEEAAFGLQAGQLSGLVKTGYGYHIIRVEARRRSLPKDFAKKKQEYRKSALEQLRARHWQEFNSQLIEQAKVEVLSPELRAWRALLREQDKQGGLRALQAASEQEAKLPGDVASGVWYQLGELHLEAKQYDKARLAFESAQSRLDDSPVPLAGALDELYLGFGDIERAKQHTKEALEWYRSAGQGDDPLVHYRLLAIYRELGQQELLAAEQRWQAEYKARAERAREEQLQKLIEEAQKTRPSEGKPPAPAAAEGRPKQGQPEEKRSP